MRSVISPTSSRNTVPRSASSSLPALSRYAPVKLPLTCPNNSDSSSVSGRPAQFIATNGAEARGTARVNGARHELLADAALAGHEHLGFRRRDASNLVAKVLHLATAADQFRVVISPHCCLPHRRFRANDLSVVVRRTPLITSTGSARSGSRSWKWLQGDGSTVAIPAGSRGGDRLPNRGPLGSRLRTSSGTKILARIVCVGSN